MNRREMVPVERARLSKPSATFSRQATLTRSAPSPTQPSTSQAMLAAAASPMVPPFSAGCVQHVVGLGERQAAAVDEIRHAADKEIAWIVHQVGMVDHVEAGRPGEPLITLASGGLRRRPAAEIPAVVGA